MKNPASAVPGRVRRLPRFLLCWGAKSSVRGNWYLGLIGFHQKGTPREVWVLISLRGLMLWSAGVAIVTYFAGAAVLVHHYQKNPFNRIGYTDLVLPHRWSELRPLRGQALIDEGFAKMHAKQYVPAFHLLNQGMARKPDHLAARMVVGQFYASGGYLQRAMQIYLDGLPYAKGERRYLENLFRIAEYLEDYEGVLRVANHALAVTPSPALDHQGRWLQEKRLLAWEKLGRHEAILAEWEASREHPSMRLETAWARTLTATGRGQEAMEAILADPNRFGLLREPWELLLELAENEGHEEHGRHALAELIALEPMRYRFHARHIAYLAKIRAVDEARALVPDYFLRFGGDQEAVARLLAQLEENRSPELLDEIWNAALAHGQAGPAARIAYVQNLLLLGQVQPAHRQYLNAREVITANGYRDDGWTEGTALLFELLLNDSPSSRSLFWSYLQTNPVGPDGCRTLIASLLAAERTDTAHEVATLARNRFPHIRDLPEIILETAVATTVPTVSASTSQTSTIPQGRLALEQLEAELSSGRWAAALEQVQIIENSPLAREMAEALLNHRLRIHGHLGQLTEVTWYMRRLLEQPRPNMAELRSLAMELHAADRKDSALSLLREVLRKYPDTRWSVELQRTWSAELKGAPLPTND